MIYRASAHRNALTGTNSILDVLQNWDANFPVLQEIVAFLDKESLPPGAATRDDDPPGQKEEAPGGVVQGLPVRSSRVVASSG